MTTRKDFLRIASMVPAGLLIFPQQLSAQEVKPAVLSATLVKDFVGKAHRDMDAVLKMHKEIPTLLNAAWDWGGGDFETALGAASHVGYIELVNYLIEQGAQMNFLTLCLLGKTEMVNVMLTDYPFLLNMKGPHGFTPLHHANQGGENALAVKELLEKGGAKETKVKLVFKM